MVKRWILGVIVALFAVIGLLSAGVFSLDLYRDFAFLRLARLQYDQQQALAAARAMAKPAPKPAPAPTPAPE